MIDFDREPRQRTRRGAQERHAPRRGITVQAKLRVGAVDDPLEREADRVADAVLRRLSSPPHVDGTLPATDTVPSTTRVQRTARSAEPGGVGLQGGELGPDLTSRIQRATAGGSPLGDGTRQRMEGAFGEDFSNVRLHGGAESRGLSQALNARAFTTGSHIFLGPGAPAPGTSGGDRLLAHELAHTLQQGGSRIRRSSVVQREVTMTENPLYESGMRTNPLYQGPAPSPYPQVGDVKGEAVLLETESDHFEATVILNELELSYGVVVRSDKVAKAVSSAYTRAPKDVRKAVQAGVWQMKELRALERAVAHYAPILGANRKGSTRGKTSQEVKYVGKVEHAIDVNSSKGVLDDTTLGEYFGKHKALGLFDAGTDSTEDFADNLKQLEATAVHEMAHGLFGHEVKGWASHFEFWYDRYNESGKSGAEEPPSEYGKTNADEDLCESVMFYFVDEARLKASAPLRHAYVKAMVEGWKKTEKAKKGKGKK